MQVGDVVELKVPCMGNMPGTKGVVYDTYQDFDNPFLKGVCVIFKNGEYSGFSFDEQMKMLTYLYTTPLFYDFKNVMQLSRDFDSGLFNDIFE